MALFTKFNDFPEQLSKGVHVFGTHAFKLALCNAANAPSASLDALLADIVPIAYTNLGGAAPSVTVACTETPAGTSTVTGVSLTITATATAPAFRYYALYNDTATNKNLVCFWDHGTEVTLNIGETFSVKFSDVAVGSTGTIFTLA